MPEALRLFGEIVKTEQEQGEKGDWGFKALKQMTKITFYRVSDLVRLLISLSF
jgi:hypothetical protein